MPITSVNKLSAIALLAISATLLTGAAADSQAEGTILRISGEGEVATESTSAIMQVGITTFATSVGRAVSDNASKMATLRNRLRRIGIDPRDVSTRNFTVSEQERRPDPNESYRERGFSVTQTLVITYRDIDQLGPALDALVEAGADNINGPTFYADATPRQEQAARQAAIEDANSRAAEYARGFGLRILGVRAITAGGVHVSENSGPVMRAVVNEAQSTEINRSQQTVRSSVSVEFELGR